MNAKAIIILGVLAGLGPFAVEFYLTAQNHLVEQFHTSPNLVSLNVGVFFIGMAVGQFLGGPLSDVNGRRPLALTSLFLFTAASVMACFATTIYTFLFLRGIQALGAGIVAVLAYAIVSDQCNETSTAKFISLVTFVAIFIRVLSPIAGSHVTAGYGWQAPLLIMALIGLLTFIYFFYYQPETYPAELRSKFCFDSVFRDYSKLLVEVRSRTFIGFEVLSSISLFAYVSTAPLIFMNTYDLDVIDMGYAYTGTTLILMISAYANIYIVAKMGVSKILKITISSTFYISVILIVMLIFHQPSLQVFVFLICIYMVPMMMTRLNATAAAMKCFPSIAGTTASLISVIGFAFGGLVSLLSSYLYDQFEFGLIFILFATAFLNLLLYLGYRSELYSF